MKSERVTIYRVLRLAETMCVRAEKPLYSFLVLYSLLRHGGRSSDSFLLSTTEELCAAHATLRCNGSFESNVESAVSEAAESASVEQIAFSLALKQEELMTRIRAVEYLIYGVGNCLHAHPCFSTSSETLPLLQQQPITPEATREGLRLAEQLLRPLFTSMQATPSSCGLTNFQFSMPELSPRADGIFESYFFREADLAPLVWPTLSWCLPTLKSGFNKIEKITGSQEDCAQNREDLIQPSELQMHSSIEDIWRPIPISLLVKAYILQSIIERRRRSYKCAVQKLEAARKLVYVIFSESSTQRWIFLLLEELRSRWQLEGNNSGKAIVRFRRNYLEALELALPILFFYEQQYCLALLAVEECRIHHMIIHEANNIPSHLTADKSFQAAAIFMPSYSATSVGAASNIKTSRDNVRNSISRLKEISAIYKTLIGKMGSEVLHKDLLRVLSNKIAHSSFTSSHMVSAWLSALAESIHSACFVSVFSVVKLSAEPPVVHKCNTKAEKANLSRPDEMVSANALQLARVLAFYNCYACSLEAYITLSPSRLFPQATPIPKIEYASFSSTSPLPPISNLHLQLDKCVRLFDQSRGKNLEFDSDFRAMSELAWSDAVMTGNPIFSAEEEPYSRSCSKKSTMTGHIGVPKSSTEFYDEQVTTYLVKGEKNSVLVNNNITWTSPRMRRAIRLYLRLCRCYAPENACLKTLGGDRSYSWSLSTSSQQTAKISPTVQNEVDSKICDQPYTQSYNLNFPQISDESCQDLLNAYLPLENATQNNFQTYLDKMNQIFGLLLQTIEEELLVLTGNSMRATNSQATLDHWSLETYDVHPTPFLHSCVLSQARFLIQLKASAWLKAAAVNLTQLRLGRAVQHLRELQAFMVVFSRYTWPMRVEMHLLVACLAMHLSVRDLSLSLLPDQIGSDVSRKETLMDVFFNKGAGIAGARGSNFNATPFRHHAEAVGELQNAFCSDVVARDVGLPMAHLLAAESYLRNYCVANAAAISSNIFLLHLFKAMAVSQVVFGGCELKLIDIPFPSLLHTDNLDGSLLTQGVYFEHEGYKDLSVKRFCLEQEGLFFSTNESFGVKHEAGLGTRGYEMRQLEPSQQRRCKASLIYMVQSLIHHSRLKKGNITIERNERLSSTATETCTQASGLELSELGNFFVCSPLHYTLLCILEGFVALAEGRDEAAAIDAFQSAVVASNRHFGLFHPSVADSLVCLVSLDGVCSGDIYKKKDDECILSRHFAVEASYLEFLASRACSKVLTNGESFPGTCTALEIAACTSYSALFRLLEVLEKKATSPEVTLSASMPPQTHELQALRSFSLMSIQQWWEVQVHQVCNKFPVKLYADYLPATGFSRTDLVQVLTFLPTMSIYPHGRH